MQRRESRRHASRFRLSCSSRCSSLSIRFIADPIDVALMRLSSSEYLNRPTAGPIVGKAKEYPLFDQATKRPAQRMPLG